MARKQMEPRGVAAVWTGAEQSQVIDHSPHVKQQNIDLNLAALWRIVWLWRWVLLASITAGIAAAIVVTLLTTPLYRAKAVIELNPPAVEVMEGKGPQFAQNDQSFVETQGGLLRSRALSARVAQDLNLASNEALVPNPDLDRSVRQRIATDILSSNLKVTASDRTRLVEISYSSPDPQLAARIVNGFADSYIQTSLERRYQASSYARDFLQRQIVKVRRDLENSERQLVAYAQQQGIIRTQQGEGGGSSDTNSLAGASLVALNDALAAAETKRIAAEQQYREATRNGNSTESAAQTSLLRGERAKLESEYREKATIFKPDYPELVALRSRIDALDEAVRKEANAVQAGQAGSRRAEYQAAAATENELRDRVERLRGSVLDLRGRSIQYTILKRDVDTNSALYEALLQRFKEIGVGGGIGASYASIVDRAEAPQGPYKPDMLMNLLLGLLAGAGLGLGAALAFEFINDTIKTPDDVRERLHLAFLGGIPTSKGQRPVEALRESTSPLTEAYFSAGTALQFTTEDGVPRTLLVTSTRPAEGKSTTTWALAQHFARLGKRTLLIDADMRKPAFVTGDEKDDGLSNMLTTHDPLEKHVRQTDSENLWLLPCGPIPPNPAELLASARMPAILAQAEEAYDMVIVDGPPILGLADSPLLSTAANGALLVVEAGKTRTRAAVEALNRLRGAGANVVGAILTRYRHESTGYGYNYDAYTYRASENRNRQIRAVAGRGE
ncbi:capsular exopolysaccharide synthesis family protein [Sphingomonas kyeonggiensis]|uniref:GumC family protein n=1 Tax=Sphingomonas kyeonggiensis TaxID=1268553 RepID=UPI002785A499|nr:polysaccharide biosynthesis tyrosine autokinase [Sphingomonas kyeonggiensis]MDQ0250195.1 capsular exopolysaccharide synthesis family protein [Sphingomonas kyeonggiensis]